MKKHIRTLVFAALIAGAFACAKETNQVPTGSKIQTNLQATFQAVTKATMDSESGIVEWEAGDQISLIYGRNNFALTGKTSGTATEFTGETVQLPSGEKYIAVYPYDKNYRLDGHSFTFTLPKEPKLIPGSFSQAVGTGYVMSGHVNFHHATAYLGFEVTRDDISSIIIVSEGKHLSGTFNATVINSGATILEPVAKQTSKEIIIKQPLAGKYYLPVYPDRYNRIKIALISAKATGTNIINKPLTLTAGNITELGKIDEGIQWENDENPAVQVCATTSSTASASWSVSNFMSPETDNLYNWSVGLYKDSNLSDLLVSWDIPSTMFTYPEGTIYGFEGLYSPRFIFTGLEANTEYYVSVWKTAAPEYKTAGLSLRTLAWDNVQISETATGDVILAEDFSELVWGGDIAGRFWGYSDNNRSSANRLNSATGENPVGVKTINGFRHDFYLVNPIVGIGLFNTLGKAIGSTRLADWKSIASNNADGMVCAHPGYVRIGTGDAEALGGIVTPMLSRIGSEGTIRITFKAQIYRTTATDNAPQVKVMAITADDSSISSGGTITSYTIGSATDVTLSQEQKWTEYSCDLNVTGNERIAIYAQRPEKTTGPSRILVDDIKIEVVNYL